MQQETPTTPTEARVKNKRRISPFWLLPFIALLIAGWLVYNNFQERGTTVTIDFQSAAGIVAGRTPVRYQALRSARCKNQPEQRSAQHRGGGQHQKRSGRLAARRHPVLAGDAEGLAGRGLRPRCAGRRQLYRHDARQRQGANPLHRARYPAEVPPEHRRADDPPARRRSGLAQQRLAGLLP